MIDGYQFKVKRKDELDHTEVYHSKSDSNHNSGNITSPMPGKVIKVNVQKGSIVKKGALLLIVEAMKMENNILAPMDAEVVSVLTSEQMKVNTSDILVTLKPKV